MKQSFAIRDQSWRDDALCMKSTCVTTDDFFYEGRFRKSSEAQLAHIALLRSVCNACPVFEQCDADANFGVSGAVGFRAGVTVHARKKRKAKEARERRVQEVA